MMSKQIFGYILLVLVVAGIGFIYGRQEGLAEKARDFRLGQVSFEAVPDEHGRFDVTEAQLPQMDLKVTKDMSQGWNLEVVTDDFTFMPHVMGIPERLGEGHAHLYVGNTKVARIYSPHFHLGYLPEGENEITLRLSTNMHNEYWVNDRVFEISTTVINEVQ